ncbi:MAG: ribonuclease III [Endomicrobiaceae bacterium]|nr:ribonuclease III [Endomicrobiaceae bacterium]
MSDKLEEVQKNLGYEFHDLNFLKIALTHRSYSSEYGLKYCNERMEFLGDSILSAVVSEYLYNKYSDDEGKLSQIKAQIVSAKSLSSWAKKIKLHKFIFISKSEELNLARHRDSLLCDSFEAVIGAIYLDSNFENVKSYINKFLNLQQTVELMDYKTSLQELVQAQFQTLPEYKVVKEYGPDHDKKFEIAVFIEGKQFGFGRGSSKKEAEQNSAKQAYRKLNK